MSDAQSSATIKIPLRKSTLIGVSVISIILFALVMFVLFSSVSSPNPEVVMVDGYEGLQGLNYVYYVDARVQNHGASGWVTLYAEINGAGRYEKQNMRIYLGNGEIKTATFTFDITVLGTLSNPSIKYKAWVTS
ncbi:MAG: hypothetical protein NWF05_06880 [Candidatus Bathyarchaeota archaeon]|nr:hypothetical protein [Candidatus Bathyarchaeota archaeon]